MKIVAINASLRGDRGRTRFLLDRLLEGASEAGAECEVVTLARLKINRCLACDWCHAPEHPLQCVQAGKDDVRDVFEKMAGADLLVYATPVYVFGLSSLLKTLIERMYGTGDVADLRLADSGLMFHHVDRAVCSKPFAALVCCDNLEAEMPRNAVAYFRTYARFMDAPLAGLLVRNGGGLTGQLAGSPRLAAVHAAYAQAGRELALHGRISAATARRANQEIVPVPLFGWLKRLSFKPLKRRFVAEAHKLMAR